MSDVKIGDRVKVEYEGTVTRSWFGWREVSIDGDCHVDTPCATCTVIVPPVKVGDIITTVDQLDRLGHGAVIQAAGGNVASKLYDNEWYILRRNESFPPCEIVDHWKATVLSTGASR